MSRVEVIYKTGLGLDDWIYWHLIHSTRNSELQVTQRYRYSAHFQFTVTHALVVSWQRISKSLSFQSYMNSSLHSLIPFLP
jgi:hypothetical protein